MSTRTLTYEHRTETSNEPASVARSITVYLPIINQWFLENKGSRESPTIEQWNDRVASGPAIKLIPPLHRLQWRGVAFLHQSGLESILYQFYRCWGFALFEGMFDRLEKPPLGVYEFKYWSNGASLRKAQLGTPQLWKSVYASWGQEMLCSIMALCWSLLPCFRASLSLP